MPTFLAVWVRRWRYRRDEACKRRLWQQQSPEVQCAMLIDYIARNRRLRSTLRKALLMKEPGERGAK